MADSGWNPLRMYNKFKEDLKYRHNVMPFWDRFWGVFFMFSGHVLDPSSSKVHGTLFIDSNAKVEGHHGSNQWGIYDYLTLRIPRTIEDICLGNWCASWGTLKGACMLLTFPIWIPLVLIRYGLGLIGAFLSTPVIGVMCLYDNHIENIKEANSILVKGYEEQKKFDLEAETYEQNLKTFNKNYGDLKSDFKNETFDKSNALKHHENAISAGYRITRFFDKHELIQDIGFNKKLTKLEMYGKYSHETILQNSKR